MQVIVRIVEKMRTDLKCGTHETSSYPLGGAHQGFGVGEALEEAISAWRSIRRPPERPDIAASGRVRTNERTRQRTNKQTNKQTRRITIPPRGGINVGLRFLFFLLSVIRVIDQIRCRTRCTYTELSLSHNAALFIGRSRAITREFFTVLVTVVRRQQTPTYYYRGATCRGFRHESFVTESRSSDCFNYYDRSGHALTKPAAVSRLNYTGICQRSPTSIRRTRS